VLSEDENRILTRVGRETPMGRLMRRFWLPVCTTAQVGEPDGRPLRTSLLGESLVVFRDSAGQLGVLDEHCMHRGVSLALGRNEHGGLRCLYHGWKFGVDGSVLEIPNSRNSKLCQRMRAPVHPVREAGGLVWTYLGPREQQPPLPHYGFMDGPAEHRAVVRLNTSANYLQLFEGGVDSSHIGVLHSAQATPAWMQEGAPVANDAFAPQGDADVNLGALAVSDNAPDIEIEDTDFGFHSAALRRGAVGDDGSATFTVRVTAVILPVLRITPAANSFQFFTFEVPMSDTQTATYVVGHGPAPLDRTQIIDVLGLGDQRFWNDQDCTFRASWADGLGQDRDLMATNWTGYAGIEQEDAVLSLSMGSILDRSKEHMIAADYGVIHLRARLLESVRRNENGQPPIGVDRDEHTTIRSVNDTTIGSDRAWPPLVADACATSRPRDGALPPVVAVD
jgi:phthalate 4,5-dioxygenase